MGFPAYRPRRMRANPAVRAFVRETRVEPGDLVYPVFVKPGAGVRDEVASMPGVFQLSIDQLAAEVDELRSCRVNSLMLFGLPARKDERGSEAYDDRGVVQQAVRAIKERYPQLMVITDVCLCEYTDHGHCGLVDGERVLNDESVELLAATAVSHARAGADIVAPSDMMDGRVAAIRQALDAAGLERTAIMSYAAKFASGFYGPFREAAGSTPGFGDRKSYQMDPANGDEAVREALSDVEQGADMIIVKPALAFGDIIWRTKRETHLPVVAYNVSGEYAMVKAAAANGWLDERKVVLEALCGMKRAGADIIITYHALDAARWLAERA